MNTISAESGIGVEDAARDNEFFERTGRRPAAKVFTDFTWGRAIYAAPLPLPCPFCGFDRPSIEHDVVADHENGDVFIAVCEECSTKGPLGSSQIEAAEAWNRRSGAAVGSS